MKIWAHRGASGYAPENTLEAFKLAIDMGADGIELDVQYTKDKQIVVIHDDSIDRTSSGKGMVKNLTLEELRRYDYNCHGKRYRVSRIKKIINSTKASKAYKGCILPTLEDVLKLIKPSKLTINIEIKVGEKRDVELEADVLALVEKYEMQGRVMYSSFSKESLLAIKKINPKAVCGLLYKKETKENLRFVKEAHMDCVHPKYTCVKNSRYVKAYEEMGITIHPWTVNRNYVKRKMKKINVDAVITNYI